MRLPSPFPLSGTAFALKRNSSQDLVGFSTVTAALLGAAVSVEPLLPGVTLSGGAVSPGVGDVVAPVSSPPHTAAVFTMANIPMVATQLQTLRFDATVAPLVRRTLWPYGCFVALYGGRVN